ncbi:hypothetical protein HPFOLIGI_00506 [Mannheimia haemolytica]
MNDKRFTFKFLGVLMEAINITPKEIRKTMWTAAIILFCLRSSGKPLNLSLLFVGGNYDYS